MKKNTIIKKILMLFIILIDMSTNTQAEQFTKLWETEAKLEKPESVVYDVENNVLYTSNINGKYGAKDGNGFISKISLDGKIIDLKWVEGFDNPQGMVIYKKKLYVADLKRVVVVDIKKSIITEQFNVDSAKYFNDIAVNEKGEIFVSDIFGNKIYRLFDEKINIYSDNKLLNQPNGLLCKGANLIVLNFGNGILYKVSLNDKLFTYLTSGIRNCDGITEDDSDGYWVSGAWQGEIYHVNNSGSKELVLNLGLDKIMAADIFYFKEKHMLLVPTLNKTLIAYRYK